MNLSDLLKTFNATNEFSAVLKHNQISHNTYLGVKYHSQDSSNRRVTVEGQSRVRRRVTSQGCVYGLDDIKAYTANNHLISVPTDPDL